MVSLTPKEGGGVPPSAPRSGITWVPIALVVALVAIAGVAYSQYSAKIVLEQRIAALEDHVEENISKFQKSTTALTADIDVVTKKIGVTSQELAASREYAEKLRVDQEKSKAQLASEIATKASTTDVAAVREEAATKVAEVEKAADTKIGSVSGDVKTVASNLESTKQDLAASRREISDVRTTLSEQIARNSSELSDLRKKGERDYIEFDIRKGKKGTMSRVADIQLEVRDTDTKKQKYGIVIQVDDSKLEKKDRTANEPVQFLVGRDKLRYEIVVNTVDKDRIRGYVSLPKDKALSSEKPTFRE